jgi:hypothetical protein
VTVEGFTASTFADRCGERFRVFVDATSSFEAELVEVNELGRPSGNARAPFSLVFRGPSGQEVAQRIYRLEHEELGAFDLFLVPIGPDETGMRYEAVFT